MQCNISFSWQNKIRHSICHSLKRWGTVKWRNQCTCWIVSESLKMVSFRWPHSLNIMVIYFNLHLVTAEYDYRHFFSPVPLCLSALTFPVHLQAYLLISVDVVGLTTCPVFINPDKSINPKKCTSLRQWERHFKKENRQKRCLGSEKL